jgi:hypothetical protein
MHGTMNLKFSTMILVERFMEKYVNFYTHLKNLTLHFLKQIIAATNVNEDLNIVHHLRIKVNTVSERLFVSFFRLKLEKKSYCGVKLRYRYSVSLKVLFEKNLLH